MKELKINPRFEKFSPKKKQDEIDELRHAAVAAVIDRRDTIIVSSVSCIYSIGEKEEYVNKMLNLSVGDSIDRDVILEKLVGMQYERN